MNKDYKVYLEDMINAINEVEKSTIDVSFEAFASNYEKLNSVAYTVFIISEAANKIPQSMQENNTQIP